MILGCYYLTRDKKGQIGEGMSSGSIDEVKIAHDNGKVAMHAIINVRHNGCLLYTSPSPRDQRGSRMPSSA